MRLRMVSPLTTHFLMSVRDGISYITSISVSSRTVRRPRAPVLWRMASSAQALQAVVRELQLDVVQAEEALELAGERVLGLGEDAHQRVDVERLER